MQLNADNAPTANEFGKPRAPVKISGSQRSMPTIEWGTSPQKISVFRQKTCPGVGKNDFEHINIWVLWVNSAGVPHFLDPQRMGQSKYLRKPSAHVQP